MRQNAKGKTGINGSADPKSADVRGYLRTLLEYYANDVWASPLDFQDHEWVEIHELTVEDVSD